MFVLFLGFSIVFGLSRRFLDLVLLSEGVK